MSTTDGIATHYPNHPAAASAILEKATYGISKIASAREFAEVGLKLTERLHWHRQIHGTTLSNADERCDVGTQHNRLRCGGVGTLDHLVEGIRDGHATAVLAASIFHFGTHTIGEAKRYMAKAGIAMRLDPPGDQP